MCQNISKVLELGLILGNEEISEKEIRDLARGI